MSEPHAHVATVEWSHKPEGVSYSRRHTWTFDGGLRVPASSSPSVVRPPYSDPSAVDPEEALVAAVSSCHMLWFLDLAKRRGFPVAHYADHARGIPGKNEEGRDALVAVELRPRIVFQNERPKPEELAALHEAANHHCFIAASLRCVVHVRENEAP